uniref:ADP-ribosyltransferase-containing protein n=1 Tax=Helicobacter mesocricetorum TaxID=87012 RepID=UPI0013152BE1
IERGKLIDLENGKVRIITDKYTIGMKKEWKDKPTNAYILTAFENNEESAKNLHSSTLTKGETLPLNSDTIIPQSPTNQSNNQSILDKALKEKQEGIIKEQELTTAIKPIDNIQTPTLKEEFATANTSQKISIERELLKENEAKPFAYHTRTPKGIASLRADLKEALSPYINKEITNKETGLSGTISIKEINKISSSKAVDKSIYNGFSRDEHFKVSEHLKELFENAHLKQTHTDYKGKPNIQAVHRFNTPLSINDKEAVAKITLFEKRLGNNKIYSLELEGLSSATLSKDADNTGAAVKAQSVESPHNKSTTIAKTDEAIIPQIQNKFKYDATKAKDLSEWHKESHPITKDEQGLPKVFYHGSKAENLQVFINTFDSTKWGFWFGTDKDFVLKAFADSNKEQFTQAFLKMKNPLDATKTFDIKTLQELKGILNLDNKDMALYKSLSKEFANIKKELDKKGFAFVSYGGGLVEAKPLMHKNKDLINELYEEWNILTDKERKGYTKDRQGLIEALQKDLGLFKDDLTLKNIIKYYDGETLFFKPRELIALNRFDNEAPQALRDIQHLDNELGLLLGMKGKAQYSNINTRELLQAKGYDGIILNDDVSVVFDSNQIKAVENKGSIFNKTSGDFKTATTKDTTKEGFKYFNEQSPNIYHSNPHLGSGLVGGSIAGFEIDEQGNLSFNPQNFLLGLAAGSIGSKAVAQGFKALKDNPAFKERLQQELANTLSRGWESAIKQYPILQSLEPRYIIKNEKGREIQAKGVLKELEITPIQNALKSLESTPTPQKLTDTQIQKLLKEFDILDNLKEHLNTRTEDRKQLYNLLLDAKDNPQIHYKKDLKDKYLKKYKSTGKEPYFYLLITQDKDKTFITHFKTRDIKYLSEEITDSDKIIKGADIIEELSQRTGDNQLEYKRHNQRAKQIQELNAKLEQIDK